MQLEDLTVGTSVRGILPDGLVTVVGAHWYGSDALELTYKTAAGQLGNELLYRHDEARLAVVEQGRPWSFDGDGATFRLVSEAHRIRLAHLFDPVLAVHTSLVTPLPHQITAVYEHMLPRQPLRFLLADDPGAGKTIMAGLLVKELIVRGDLQRCLVVCPGSLAEQWQDELWRRFQLPFEILTHDKLEAARTGNWFAETPLVIARLDKLSRDEAVQAKLLAPEAGWDLVVCDEAHKLSATFFGGEVKYTRRYRLAQLLGGMTRHLLLMTATPHNGKDEDFQLFLALLDDDRFEGRFRDGVHQVEVSDLMRRTVKESLLKFDGTPLFPERVAHTVPYEFSPAEAQLYREVTDYVRQEFNRAEALQNDRRAGTVGFALTVLQRRLASSPEALYQSLRRRRERLEQRLSDIAQPPPKQPLRGPSATAPATSAPQASALALDAEDLADLEDAPDGEIEAAEDQVLDQATAARTMAELRTEIGLLAHLESLALALRCSGTDRKWYELASLLDEIFSLGGGPLRVQDSGARFASEQDMRPQPGPGQKLVIFTEHRDTLAYLQRKISDRLGRPEAVQVIHGGMGRDERLKAQEVFRHDPVAKVLVATDAAGEGINLQRAHLMVNYDLPWNPNRLEQRFGRIHRIGQTEVCHLWNLVADQTREGEVYLTLLAKLEQARTALGGQVFDVLGKLVFQGQPLRELLIEAIRYGERPDVRARLTQAIAGAVNAEQLQALIEDRALANTALSAAGVARVRDEMARAEARRLQPHYVESFFLEAFRRLGGSARPREARRHEVTHVPAPLRNRPRLAGMGDPVQPRYERIAFDKAYVTPPGQAPAAFVCPGHPLLDATLDLTLERHRDLLRQGAVLVDERDAGTAPRVLFYLEHAVQDASATAAAAAGPAGARPARRTVSRQMLYVELDAAGRASHLQYAPYLDYRPLAPGEPGVAEILAAPACVWIARDLEARALAHAVAHVVPAHLSEVRTRRLAWVDKTRAAVKDRLTKEIAHWDHRAQQLQAQEGAGQANARLNSQEARRRADELQARLQKRLAQLDLEAQISALPPVAVGGLLVLPRGLLEQLRPRSEAGGGAGARPELADEGSGPVDTAESAARARAAVMAAEARLGWQPVDREFERLGYDIESRHPATGALRFIEVKGRVAGARHVTVTRNEILYSLNQPDAFILAIVVFHDGAEGREGGRHTVHYLRQPFRAEPDFGATSVNYDLAELLARAGPPG